MLETADAADVVFVVAEDRFLLAQIAGGDEDEGAVSSANFANFPSKIPTVKNRFANQDSTLNDEGYDSEGNLPYFADEQEDDIEGYEELPIGGDAAAPTPHEQVIAPHPDHLAFMSMLSEAGTEVVIEHGVVAGEVLGLEVARVLDEDGVAKLRIGVGAHDREMFKMLHGDVSTIEQLQKVVNLLFGL